MNSIPLNQFVVTVHDSHQKNFIYFLPLETHLFGLPSLICTSLRGALILLSVSFSLMLYEHY